MSSLFTLLHTSRMARSWVYALCGALGLFFWITSTSVAQGLNAMLLTFMGFALSTDNVIVVLPLLSRMSRPGQALFFSAGFLVSVFGVQIALPMYMVSAITHTPIGQVSNLALNHADKFAALQSLTEQFMAVGATSFLASMSLEVFFDPNKRLHWWPRLETKLANAGKYKYLAYTLVGTALAPTAMFAPTTNRVLLLDVFIVTYVGFGWLNLISQKVEAAGETHLSKPVRHRWYRTLGLIVFVCFLEVLFSIDTLASAFTVTSDITVVVVSITAGGLLMRAFMLHMVKDNKLRQFRYLQIGAYYTLLWLAFVAYLQGWHIEMPQPITIGISVALPGLAMWHSHHSNKRDGGHNSPPDRPSAQMAHA